MDITKQKQNSNPTLLKLADYEDPILRQMTEPVSFPLSKEDKQIIESMKYSIQKDQLKKVNAPWDDAAGMAANQWKINKSIFIYCPNGTSENEIEVIINPSYEPLNDPSLETLTKDATWEGCFSVPLATGNVQRFTHIRVKYQNEAGETIVKELSGWPARVWQHENDHLYGLLYNDPKAGKCTEFHQFPTKEAVEAFYLQLREERKKEYESSGVSESE